jgi:APA family basic amino acid/polyamine antiporter
MKPTAKARPAPSRPAARPRPSEPRVGTFTAACLLISNAIGSGIFTTTGFMARDLGDPRVILLLWALGGVLALAGAMAYSELGAAMPRSGGEYVYLRRAYGPLLGFLSGWTSFTMGFGAPIAAAAVAFASFALQLVPADLPLRDPTALALLLVWTITLVHALGVEPGGRLQRLLTVLKVGGIGLLLVLGLVSGRGNWGHLALTSPDVEPRIGAAFVSLVFVLYAFSGWNAAAYIAGEIRSPARSLPRALIAGTLFVSGLYLAVNAVYFYALPAAELAREPVLPVAEKVASSLFGPPGSAAVIAVLCLSIAGATSSMIWAGPRVYAAMALDRVIPSGFAQASAVGAPVRSILLQSVWVSLLLASGTFEQLVIYSGVALALFSGLAVASLIVLRRREPDLARPYRVALYPWLPLLYVAASLCVAAYATVERPLEALLAIGTVAVGIPLYYLWRR